MEGSRDFIHCLGEDLSIKILTCLEDPDDLKRVCLVSSCWRQFVITNGLSKKLCVKMFPETSRFSSISEIGRVAPPVENGTEDSCESLYMKMEHRAFMSLINEITAFSGKKCISDALFASSTDNYPTESVINTLEPRDRVENRASYWSSKGHSDPNAPETLIFKLASPLCLINEVHVHPFQAYFQYGLPIYSANAVRFHLGHPKVQLEPENDDRDLLGIRKFSEDMFVWTYTSPQFPMAQENCLQKFKLPKPVLCIGGIVKVELLGRVQTQEVDGLYYICISHVQAIGRPLSTLAFDVEMLEEKGTWKLIHYRELDYHFRPPPKSPSNGSPSRFHRFSASLRSWEMMIMNTLRRNGHAMVVDDDSEEESDVL